MATDENPYLAEPSDYTDPEWLYEMYYIEGKSVEEMAEMEGVSSGSIVYEMDKHDLPRFPAGLSKSQRNIDDLRHFDPEWLREKYWDEENTIAEIAEIIGCSPTTIYDRMECYGIERRSSKEAARLRYENEGCE